MPFADDEVRSRHPAALAIWAGIFAAGATLAVVTVPLLHFAYRAPALHVSIETANAVIALLVAYLVYGRFTRSWRLQELLLVLALCTVAVANLVLTALPFAVNIGRDEDFSRWAALAIRLIGTVILLGAAFTSPELRIRRREALLSTVAITGLVVTVGALAIASGEYLPPTVDPSLALDDATGPLLAGHPAVLAVQAVGSLLYSAAAFAFTRQYARTGDELMRWVGAACVLAAAARVHYLLFPSLYSEYVYTGDLLRLGFYLLLLVGAGREIRSYWETVARAAVLEDRRRMARELHDGLAQELTYIAAQSQRLARQPGNSSIAERIRAAASRALDETRRAIAALTRRVDEPFAQGLQRLVDDLSHRHEVEILVDLDKRARVDAAQSEALLRIVAEAVGNGVRHGGAQRIQIRLTTHPLCLAVIDEGRGFDPEQRGPGGFGITSMRERAAELGAELSVTSRPGEGATVRVTWR